MGHVREIREITNRLYADAPKDILYHYTSFSGLLGIVKSRSLWASDIRYMNDSAELRHTAHLIKKEASRRIEAGHDNPYLLNQFLYWVSHRITNVHMLFGASFRSNGNLLSQWRSYSALGKGVSLGFDPAYIMNRAEKQAFQIGKCVYDPSEQQTLIGQVIDAVEALAASRAGDDDEAARRSGRDYHEVFNKVESDVLRLAAVLKHPSFQEEAEWRIVSPVLTDYASSPVLFREGDAMLVPYVEFRLADDNGGPISLDHLFLGPTPNIEISMNSLTMFLSKNGIFPANGITYCQIPCRKR